MIKSTTQLIQDAQFAVDTELLSGLGTKAGSGEPVIELPQVTLNKWARQDKKVDQARLVKLAQQDKAAKLADYAKQVDAFIQNGGDVCAVGDDWAIQYRQASMGNVALLGG